jgi:hypothetical protein
MWRPIQQPPSNGNCSFPTALRTSFIDGDAGADGRFEWDSAPVQETCFWFEADGYQAIRGLSLVADGSDHKIELKTKPNESH